MHINHPSKRQAVLLIVMLQTILTATHNTLKGQDQTTYLQIKTHQKGIYKINYSDLATYSQTDQPIPLKNIRIYGVNLNAERVEIPLEAHEKNKNKLLETDEYLIFFANHPHRLKHSNKNITDIEFNIYHSYNRYRLEITNHNNSKTFETPTYGELSENLIAIDYHHFFLFKDVGKLHINTRKYAYQKTPDHTTISFNRENYTEIQNAYFKVKCMASKELDLSISSGNSQKKIRLRRLSDTSIQITPTKFEPSSLSVRFDYDQNVQPQLLIDHLTLNIKGKLSLKKGHRQISFHTLKQNETADYGKYFIASEAPEKTSLLDVTDPYHPKRIPLHPAPKPKNLFFYGKTHTAGDFIAFNDADLLIPELSKVTSQTSYDYSNKNLIILSDPEMMPTAEILSRVKTDQGFHPIAVNVEDIYNTYGNGLVSPSILSHFMDVALKKSGGSLKYILLLGGISKGSKKNHIPLDYDAPLETATDDTYHRKTIYIGRIPALSNVEAEVWTQKIETYPSPGIWQTKFVFIADDYKKKWESSFTTSLSNTTREIEKSALPIRPYQIFLDEYESATDQNEIDSRARFEVEQKINEGVSLVSFLGHGNQTAWSEENILNEKSISRLSNAKSLGVFTALTCAYGEIDDHLRSGSEHLLFKKNGGAVAVLSTTREIRAGLAIDFNGHLFKTLIKEFEHASELSLGEWIQRAKETYRNPSEVENIILLGDPSMKIPLPKMNLELNTLNGFAVKKDSEMKISSQKIVATGMLPTLDSIQEMHGVLLGSPSDVRSKDRNRTGLKITYTKPSRSISKVAGTSPTNAFKMELIIPHDALPKERKEYLLFISAQTKDKLYGAKQKITLTPNIHSIDDTQAPSITVYVEGKRVLDQKITSFDPVYNIQIAVEDNLGINTNAYSKNQKPYLEMRSKYETNRTYLNTKYTPQPNQSNRKGAFDYRLHKGLFYGETRFKAVVWDAFGNKMEKEFAIEVIPNTGKKFKIVAYPNPFSIKISFRLRQHQELRSSVVFTVGIFTLAGKRLENRTLNIKHEEFLSQKSNGLNVCTLNLPPLPSGVYIGIVEIRTPEGYLIQRTATKLIKHEW